MKILHIIDYDIHNEVLNGGAQVAAKNHNILECIAGKENVYLLSFTKYCSTNFPERNFALPACDKSIESIICALLGYRRFNPKYKKRIKEILEQVKPDLVFLDSSELGQITKLLNSNTKCMALFHNIEIDYIWKNRIKRRKISGVPFLWGTWINEKLTVQKCNALICLTERDNKRIREVYKRTADLIMPISFEDKYNETKVLRNGKERKLLFIGSLFPPNYQGIKWFIDSVMEKLPEFELTIVGRNFEKKREELNRKNVKVVGTVNDLEIYYYTYCSVVMPILYGDGMKVKTCEAMMYGMNIFATDEALEGYEVENVNGIYRCNSADAFIRTIKNAYDKNEIEECAHSVRETFIRNHRIDSQINRIKELINLV